MTRKAPRKIHREIIRIMESGSGDCCSNFAHQDMTFGGITHDGATALVGECCLPRMKAICTAGVYLKNTALNLLLTPVEGRA